jgi:hypothetical protein
LDWGLVEASILGKFVVMEGFFWSLLDTSVSVMGGCRGRERETVEQSELNGSTMGPLFLLI